MLHARIAGIMRMDRLRHVVYPVWTLLQMTTLSTVARPSHRVTWLLHSLRSSGTARRI